MRLCLCRPPIGCASTDLIVTNSHWTVEPVRWQQHFTASRKKSIWLDGSFNQPYIRHPTGSITTLFIILKPTIILKVKSEAHRGTRMQNSTQLIIGNRIPNLEAWYQDGFGRTGRRRRRCTKGFIGCDCRGIRMKWNSIESPSASYSTARYKGHLGDVLEED